MHPVQGSPCYLCLIVLDQYKSFWLLWNNLHKTHLLLIRIAHGLGDSLALVVTGARTNRVHVSPVGLLLRMLLRIWKHTGINLIQPLVHTEHIRRNVPSACNKWKQLLPHRRLKQQQKQIMEAMSIFRGMTQHAFCMDGWGMG